MTVKIGSLFSGIGGFELGLERAIPGAVTVWQCEQNDFCQKVLKKHWPNATIYDDVRNIDEKVEPVDILCGGFPCQDISIAGKQKGIQHGTRSGLWWEMHRIARVLQPRIIIMENVAAILSVGGRTVLSSLAQIGFDCEWTIISARQFGAPHIRKRWFSVAYSHSSTKTKQRKKGQGHFFGPSEPSYVQKKNRKWEEGEQSQDIHSIGWNNVSNEFTHFSPDFTTEKDVWNYEGTNYWHSFPTQSPICGRNDGLPHRVDRLKALGNAIVPQCSEWVGRQIVKSGLLDDLIGGEV